MLRFLDDQGLRAFLDQTLVGKDFSLRHLRGGHLNQNVLVTAKDKKFLLKVYRKDIDLVGLEEVHRLMRHCQSLNIPTPTPLAQDKHNGYNLALYTFLDGEHPSRFRNTRSRLESMGAMLGRIDFALTSFVSRDDRPSYDKLVKWDPEVFLQEIKDLRLLLRSRPIALRQEINSNLDVYERIVQGGEWSTKPFADLPMQFVHGDYHVNNLVFTGQVISGVLDWEKAGWHWLSYELVRSIMFNCRRTSSDLNWPSVEVFVAAYRKTSNSLTRLECRLAFETGFRCALFSLWSVKGYMNGNLAVRSNAIRRVRLLDTFALNRQSYGERLAKLLL